MRPLYIYNVLACRWDNSVIKLFIVVAMLGMTASAMADIHVAVASNFSATFKEIAEAYSAETGVKVLPSYASTGKLYAQVLHGAPYTLFLAADVATPEKLEQAGLTVADTRKTYAIGSLVLWSVRAGVVDGQGDVLRQGQFTRLAMANPKTAPYGMAAYQVLMRLGIWGRLRPRLVMGENIAQTYQYVSSGNAELGFVALSQVQGKPVGSMWHVPQNLHDPLMQQMVILRSGQNDPQVRGLYDFLLGERVGRLLVSHGYGLPMDK